MLLLLIMLADKPFQLQKMACPFLYLVASQFALYQSITPIFKMQYEIGFQTISVMIVRHMTI